MLGSIGKMGAVMDTSATQQKYVADFGPFGEVAVAFTR
jgi:hypothetical protein